MSKHFVPTSFFLSHLVQTDDGECLGEVLECVPRVPVEYPVPPPPLLQGIPVDEVGREEGRDAARPKLVSVVIRQGAVNLKKDHYKLP